MKDTTSQDRARIYADAFANERAKCVFLYRLIMLLDNTRNLTEKEKIDNAFRFDVDNNDINVKNLEVFNSYYLGGIEIIYDNFSLGCISKDDYIEKAYEYISAFEDEVTGISYEQKLEDLIILKV